MKLFRGFESTDECRGGFVAIGNFDGVHRGHQSMIAILAGRAKDAGVPAVVLTFDPHPIHLLRPGKAPPSLSTPERKAALLGKGGVDFMIAYPTDQQLLNLTPADFFQNIVRDRLDAKGLVEGPNFFFGKDRAGNVQTLDGLCKSAGLSLDIVPPFALGEQLVSSSTIRSLIAGGRFAEAIEMLGHPYQLHGEVVRGQERGRLLGFPTANLAGIETLLPSNGVYAGAVTADGDCRPAAINIGPNPTFGEQAQKVEVHVLGFEGDLYGRELDVDVLERLRDTVRFDGVDELKKQLAEDIKQVEAAFARGADLRE